jgi:chromosome segregation ATPase
VAAHTNEIGGLRAALQSAEEARDAARKERDGLVLSLDEEKRELAAREHTIAQMERESQQQMQRLQRAETQATAAAAERQKLHDEIALLQQNEAKLEKASEQLHSAPSAAVPQLQLQPHASAIASEAAANGQLGGQPPAAATAQLIPTPSVVDSTATRDGGLVLSTDDLKKR